MIQPKSIYGVFGLFAVFVALPFCSGIPSRASSLDALRYLPTAQGIIVVLRMGSWHSAHSFVLRRPSRLVLDVPRAKGMRSFLRDMEKTHLSDIVSVRYGNFTRKTTRIVIQLSRDATIGGHLVSGNVLLIYLRWDQKGAKSFDIGQGARLEQSIVQHTGIDSLKKKRRRLKKNGGILIVLDAGHGGIDPGTQNTALHLKEKNITLHFVHLLEKELKRRKFRVKLTRSRDVFIPLEKRFLIAEHWNASLFISIHGNHSNNRRVHGFSVYTFSDQSSDNVAAKLAKYENASNEVAGVHPMWQRYDPAVNNILLSLERHRNMLRSSVLANNIVTRARRRGIPLLQKPHRFAHFVVLESPGFPSILVELGFLSNRREAKNLCCRRAYQRKMAHSMADSVENYLHLA